LNGEPIAVFNSDFIEEAGVRYNVYRKSRYNVHL
jgi:hypothetical protein